MAAEPHYIGIDCRFAVSHSGIGRYTRSIVSELLSRKDNGIAYVLFVRSVDEPWLRTLPASGAPYILRPAPYAPYSFAEQLLFPVALKRSRIDLLFTPHFNVPFLCPVPFVCTIHDLILHRYPNQASLLKRLAYRFIMRHAVTKARRLIAVSAFTVRELKETYGAKIAQISVIPESIDERFSPRSPREREAVRTKYALPETYFLYVGNGKEHKNVPTLLQAFASLPKESSPALVLVMTGHEMDREVFPDGVTVLRAVPDSDLPSLYGAAACFVTASLYEGFCFPVLEAQACGCPVIATNVSAIPEVASPHARLVYPSVDALRKAMLNPPERRESRPALSWADAAEKTAEVLKDAL